jgi:hypothetical protein
VREYIEAHLEESVSIDALSMYHFSRAFKQSEGVTRTIICCNAACGARKSF